VYGLVCFSGDGMQPSSTATYTMLPGCECGCSLNQSSGYLVVSSATNCPSERVWLIHASDGMLIRLTVIRFDAQHGTIRVHDGNSSLANLLFQIDESSAILPQRLTSAGNTIRVEYMLTPNEQFHTDIVNGKFVALFQAVGTYL